MSWIKRKKTKMYRSVMLKVITNMRGTNSARRAGNTALQRVVRVNSTAYETDAATRETSVTAPHSPCLVIDISAGMV
jgi:hypothetical protein